MEPPNTATPLTPIFWIQRISNYRRLPLSGTPIIGGNFQTLARRLHCLQAWYCVRARTHIILHIWLSARPINGGYSQTSVQGTPPIIGHSLYKRFSQSQEILPVPFIPSFEYPLNICPFPVPSFPVYPPCLDWIFWFNKVITKICQKWHYHPLLQITALQ